MNGAYGWITKNGCIGILIIFVAVYLPVDIIRSLGRLRKKNIRDLWTDPKLEGQS